MYRIPYCTDFVLLYMVHMNNNLFHIKCLSGDKLSLSHISALFNNSHIYLIILRLFKLFVSCLNRNSNNLGFIEYSTVESANYDHQPSQNNYLTKYTSCCPLYLKNLSSPSTYSREEKGVSKQEDLCMDICFQNSFTEKM